MQIMYLPLVSTLMILHCTITLDARLWFLVVEIIDHIMDSVIQYPPPAWLVT